MSSDVTIDAGELTAFGRRVAAAHAMAGVSIAKAVKKGAQVVKEKTQSDLNSSSNGGLHVVRVRYELGTTGSQIYADIGPEDSGKTREHGHTSPSPRSPSTAPREAAERTSPPSITPKKSCPRSPNTWATPPTTC